MFQTNNIGIDQAGLPFPVEQGRGLHSTHRSGVVPREALVNRNTEQELFGCPLS